MLDELPVRTFDLIAEFVQAGLKEVSVDSLRNKLSKAEQKLLIQMECDRRIAALDD